MTEAEPRPDAESLLNEAFESERDGRRAEAVKLMLAAVELDSSLRDDALVHACDRLVLGGEADLERAEPLLEQALKLMRQDGDVRKTSRILHRLALVRRNRGDLAGASKYLEQSEAKDLIGTPGEEVAEFFHIRGLLAIDSGIDEYAQAERFLFRAVQFYEEARSSLGAARVYDSLANYLIDRGRAARAEDFAELSLKIKREKHDRLGEAISLGTKGYALLFQSRHDDARLAFQESLDISIELENPRGVARALLSLGELELRVGRAEAAEVSYRRLLEENHGAVLELLARIGLAHALILKGSIDDAEQEIQKAESVEATIDRTRDAAFRIKGYRGMIAKRRGRLEEAERLVEEARKRIRHRIDMLPFLNELRDLYHETGRLELAIEVMSAAIDVHGDCGSIQGIREVEDWLLANAPAELERLSLLRHFPREVVDKVMGRRLDDEKPHDVENLVVLFSDIRDYTTLCEGLAPTKVFEILNDWFAEAAWAIRKNHGFIDKFIGDEIMAFFGESACHPDPAADAVRAAIDLRDSLAALNLRSKALGGREIRVGIGVHAGKAAVGYIGSHLRRSYTAIGDAVNIASRLQGATKEYDGCDILISQAVEDAQRSRGVAETLYVGRPRLKGKTIPVPAYRVLGRKAPRDPARDHVEVELIR